MLTKMKPTDRVIINFIMCFAFMEFINLSEGDIKNKFLRCSRNMH